MNTKPLWIAAAFALVGPAYSQDTVASGLVSQVHQTHSKYQGNQSPGASAHARDKDAPSAAPAPQNSEAWALIKESDQAYADGKIQEAIALLDRARIAFRKDGDMHNWAESSRREAILKMDTGDHAGATDLRNQAIVYRRKWSKNDPANLAAALIARSDLENDTDALDNSVADAKEGVSLLERSAPNDPEIGTGYMMLGRAEARRDRFADAGAWYGKAVAACQGNPDAQGDLRRALASVAGNLSDLGRFDEALKAIRQAQFQNKEAAEHPFVSALQAQEALILMESGQIDAANKLLAPALENLQKSVGTQSGPWIGSKGVLCEIQLKQKSYAAALDCLTRLAPSMEKIHAVEATSHLYALAGDAERELGRYDRAKLDLDLAERWARKSPSSLPLAEVSYERGLTALAEGKTQLARQELTTALSRRSALFSESHPKVVEVQRALSKLGN